MAAYQQGDYAQAANYSEALLAVLERDLGPSHPEVATALGNLATLYALLGRHQMAGPLLERALRVREHALGATHPDVANSLYNLAMHHRDIGQYAAALPLYERALAILESARGPEALPGHLPGHLPGPVPGDLDVARVLNGLAALRVDLGDPAAAQPLLTRALAIRERALGSDHLLVASTLGNLGSVLQDLGRYAQAERHLQRAARIREQQLGATHPDVAQSLNNLAGLYDAQARYLEARTLYQRAIDIYSATLGESHPLLADSLNNLAVLEQTLGDYALAEQLHRRALEIRRTVLGDDHPDVAQSLNNLGHLNDEQGRLDEAERQYLKALANWEQSLGADHPEVATVLNNLAELHGARGRFDLAAPLHRRSIEIREAVHGLQHPELATALHNLAAFYEARQRPELAEPLYLRALQILEHALGPSHPRVATTLNGLAALEASSNRSALALAHYQRSLSIRRETLGATHPDVASSLNNIALLHASTGREQQAVALYQQALDILEPVRPDSHSPAKLPSDHPLLGTVLHNLAGAQQALGEQTQAMRNYARALSLRERVLGEGHRDVAITLNNLADLQLLQGRTEAALETIRRATRILGARAELQARSLTGADLALARADRFAFVRHVRIAHAVTSTSGSAAAHAPLMDEAFESAQRAHASSTALAVAGMATRFAAGDDRLARLVRRTQLLTTRWQRLETKLARVAARPASERDAEGERKLRADLVRTHAELEALDGSLRHDHPRYADMIAARPLPLTDARSLLSKDEALLVWLVDNDASYLWVVTSDGARWHRLSMGEAELAASVRRLRSRLDPSRVRAGGRVPEFDTTLAWKVFSRMLEPAFEQIEQVSHLIVVNDGALQSLPLHVLLTRPPEQSGALAAAIDYSALRWLGRSHAISVLPSVSALRALRAQVVPGHATRSFIGIGNPRLSATDPTPAEEPPGVNITDSRAIATQPVVGLDLLRELPELPQTETELRTIAGILTEGDAQLLLASDATEPAVRAAALDQARVVMFATHALVSGELGGLHEPALVLTPPLRASAADDGLLSASEIARDIRLDADWVVLSACNTAAGERPGAEGLSGLTRAFFYAGTRALLVSHWPVESSAAAALTTRLFTIARTHPELSRAEALRRAMQALLDQTGSPSIGPHMAHPMYWAPFVVVGQGWR
ncbi:MAG: CHAT domain-containing protein [Gammaproteobacteria bacterium]|nr:CHAT domain-containing protein [Gammaproteobacteria bacterium]